MHIRKSLLWKEPRVVLVLVRNLFVLDPTVLLGNPVVYFLEYNQKIVSFVAIKRYRSVHELKSVYTFPHYRGKHHMSALIKHVTNKYPALVLICKPRLESFYTQFGFKRINSAPAFLRFERRFANFFISKKKSRLILMRRVTR